ncbi:MAG: DUF1285 domain-containing protein [Algicola sp.]|nr:DUF1285 domain-containing protein [Algicola sp.]
MNINQLTQQLDKSNKHPPVEKWDPAFCGDMDIQIKSDGVWWYMGTPIGRMPLVKLFASVLTTTNNEYFLVTPVEKVRIKVEDAAFVVTQWRQAGEMIVFTTNVGDEFVLSAQYSLALPVEGQTAPLYLNVHRGLQARFHRNVYYQLAEVAELKVVDGVQRAECFVVQSGGVDFVLGVDG